MTIRLVLSFDKDTLIEEKRNTPQRRCTTSVETLTISAHFNQNQYLILSWN